MSRKSTTISPVSSISALTTSSQRPGRSWKVSFSPGSGSGNGGGRPMTASAAWKPVSSAAAGFHRTTRPRPSSTAMPSALASNTARSWARCRTASW